MNQEYTYQENMELELKILVELQNWIQRVLQKVKEITL